MIYSKENVIKIMNIIKYVRKSFYSYVLWKDYFDFFWLSFYWEFYIKENNLLIIGNYVWYFNIVRNIWLGKIVFRGVFIIVV